MDCIHSQLLDMLTFFIKLAKEHNITWWLTDGSLLGQVRNNKIIPWDDDIDIGVLYKDYDKLVKLSNMDMEYRICRSAFGFKVYKSKLHSYPFIDLFVYDSLCDNPKVYGWAGPCDSSFKSWYGHSLIPNLYYKKDELFPLKLGKFNDIKVYLPYQPKKYLYRQYGEDCLENQKRVNKSHQVPFKNLVTASIVDTTLPMIKYEALNCKDIRQHKMFKLYKQVLKIFPI